MARLFLLIFCLQVANATVLREPKSITWADLLVGKSGYPSVKIQGNVGASREKTSLQQPKTNSFDPSKDSNEREFTSVVTSSSSVNEGDPFLPNLSLPSAILFTRPKTGSPASTIRTTSTPVLVVTTTASPAAAPTTPETQHTTPETLPTTSATPLTTTATNVEDATKKLLRVDKFRNKHEKTTTNQQNSNKDNQQNQVEQITGSSIVHNNDESIIPSSVDSSNAFSSSNSFYDEPRIIENEPKNDYSSSGYSDLPTKEDTSYEIIHSVPETTDLDNPVVQPQFVLSVINDVINNPGYISTLNQNLSPDLVSDSDYSTEFKEQEVDPFEKIQISNDQVENIKNEYSNEDYMYKDANYDESFFENNFYEYIDNDNQTESILLDEQASTANASQTADRRAIDFLYHMFVDPTRFTKKRRPSLLEEVITTVDKHIIEDVIAWTEHNQANQATNANAPSVLYQTPTQTQNSDNLLSSLFPSKFTQNNNKLLASLIPKKFTQLLSSSVGAQTNSSSQSLQQNYSPPTEEVSPSTPDVSEQMAIKNTYESPVINNLTPNLSGDKFLVTDEKGAQYLVSIDDIVTSLAKLDEQEVTDLLLGNPSPSNIGVPLTELGNVERPTRQISNEVAQEDNEVFAIKNSKGEIQLVTKNDLLQSLTNYKPNKFDDVSSVASSTDNTHNHATNNNAVHNPIKLLSSQNGEVHFKIGSLNPESKDKNTVVKNDENGNIHIFPAPGNKFNLNVKDIIALAEGTSSKTRSAASPAPVSPAKSVLQYLQSGFEGLPRPINTYNVPEPPINPSSHADHNTNNNQLPSNSFTNLPTSDSLKLVAEQLGISDDVINALRQQHLSDPIISSIISQLQSSNTQHQPTTQPPINNPPPSLGIASSLSSMLAGFLGARSPSTSQHSRPTKVQNKRQIPIQTNPAVKLVVRQQDRWLNDEAYGQINSNLPQSIHYKRAVTPSPAPQGFISSLFNTNRRSLEVNKPAPVAQERSGSNGSPIRRQSNNKPITTLDTLGIPESVRDYLRLQMADTPKYVPNRVKKHLQSDKKSSYNTYETGYNYVYSEPSVASYAQPQQTVYATPITSVKEVYEGPLFGLDVLADFVSVKKIDDTNLSVNFPLIGDSSRFVDTRQQIYHRR